MKKKKSFVLLVLIILQITVAFATVRKVNYSPIQIIDIYISLGKTTTITLPENSSIQSFILGSNEVFNFSLLDTKPIANIAIIQTKTNRRNVNTSLTIWTKAKTELNFNVITTTSEKADTKLIIEDTNKYFKEKNSNRLLNDHVYENPLRTDINIADYLEEISTASPEEIANLQGIDTRYTIYAKRILTDKIFVFSDDYWTYFRIAKNKRDIKKIPAIYLVGEGADQLINTRVVGGWLIAEATSFAWSIYYGNEYICVIRKDFGQVILPE